MRSWLRTSRKKAVYPVGGRIDDVLRSQGAKAVGFDVIGTPFGELGDHRSVYAAGHPNFRLSDFCDGCVIQRPFTQYEGCTIDENFFAASKLESIRELLPPRLRSRVESLTVLLKEAQRDADFRQWYRHLE